MKWLSRLLGKPDCPLTGPQAARLAALRQHPPPDCSAPLQQARYVVVDVESSGLDLARDHLLAIGAVAVSAGRIALADSFDIVLRQAAASSRSNILIHGIGHQAQLGGMAAADALLDFLEFVGNAPLLGFHARFDQAMLDKATRHHLGLALRGEWADLAHIAPALYPERPHQLHTLDDWTAQFGIDNIARHSALGDALSTAQLFLALKNRMRTQNLHHFRALQNLADARARVV